MFSFQEREIPFCFQNQSPQQNRILKVSFQNNNFILFSNSFFKTNRFNLSKIKIISKFVKKPELNNSYYNMNQKMGNSNVNFLGFDRIYRNSGIEQRRKVCYLRTLKKLS
ncbi:hypothetical protein LEP1GSC086_0070 [Leptospira weilii str. LNT 1234]|nr:hypothetical protein LEP1GSC086_0070 [Leptospira weilii str. LNT 1234]